MNIKSLPEGLGVRLAAVGKLRAILDGKPFRPLNRNEMADSRDRALANRLVTTALRRQGHINLVLKSVLERGLPGRSGNFEAIIRIALAELLFMPDQAEHAAIFLAVEAIKRDRRAGRLSKLANGILRRVQREREEFSDLPKQDLFPQWLLQRWQEKYGPEHTDRFADALLAGAPLDVTLRDEDDDLIESLGAQTLFADSVRISERSKSVVDLPGFAEGRWWVQDMSSALPARLMAQKSGAKILDMCAAPGGKTAQLVKAGYQVTALDIDPVRLQTVDENLSRLGYQAKLEQGDGTKYKPKEKFDAVLLDAPCTATGTFRRHPEAVWHRTKADIANRVALQRRLIEAAIDCLAPGGVLIYSTCSLEPEEGEEQAKWLSNRWPEMLEFGVEDGELAGFENAVDDNGWVRTWPGMQVPGGVSGTLDGFFVARFKRAKV